MRNGPAHASRTISTIAVRESLSIRSSEQANYGFLKHELQTTQAGAIDAIKSAQSAQDATVAFCNTFERPGDPQMSSRLADLQYVLTA